MGQNHNPLETVDPDRQNFERERELAASCYTPEFLSCLAHEFRIDDSKIEHLRDALATAAWVYHYCPGDAEKPDLRATRDKIRAIQNMAKQLDAELEALSEAANQVLWYGQRRVEADAFFIVGDVSPYGHTIVRRDHPSGATSIELLRQGQIREAVCIIESLARDAANSIKNPKGGRPSDDALGLWVINMRKLWEDVLGRPFTYYETEGVAVSEAFEFCQQAIKPFAPKVTTAALKTAVRKAIKIKPKRLVRSARKTTTKSKR